MPSPPIPLSHLDGSPEPERRYRLLELVRRRMAELRFSPRSTQNQALAALTFLYDRVLGQPLERVDGIAPARRSRHVPVVLSQHEVRWILAQLDDPARLCVSLMYGSRLR